MMPLGEGWTKTGESWTKNMTSEVIAGREMWRGLLVACCEKRDWHAKENGIRPMVGAVLLPEDDVKTEDLVSPQR